MNVDYGDELLHLTLTGITGVCCLICAAVGWLLRRAIGSQDALTKEVGALKTKVAILLDRDRRKRLEDYRSQPIPDSDDG